MSDAPAIEPGVAFGWTLRDKTPVLAEPDKKAAVVDTLALDLD